MHPDRRCLRIRKIVSVYTSASFANYSSLNFGLTKGLIDGHSRLYWAMLEIWKFRHVVRFLIFAHDTPLHDMWFQSLIEILHAGNPIGNGEKDQNNDDDREDCQRLPNR